MLKPQDIVILLKIVADIQNSNWPRHAFIPNPLEQIVPWNFASLAGELFISSSEVHAGFKRAVKSQLINKKTRIPNLQALFEFLVHGLKYVFPAERGEMTRGIPTAHAVAPLKKMFVDNGDLPPVWPYPKGKTWGQTFLPLYKSVPKAASADPYFYELLALVDAIRGGRARERNLAIKELQKRLGVDYS